MKCQTLSSCSNKTNKARTLSKQCFHKALSSPTKVIQQSLKRKQCRSWISMVFSLWSWLAQERSLYSSCLQTRHNWTSCLRHHLLHNKLSLRSSRIMTHISFWPLLQASILGGISIKIQLLLTTHQDWITTGPSQLWLSTDHAFYLVITWEWFRLEI